MATKLIIKGKSLNQILPHNVETLNWFNGFYTEEQLTKFEADMRYCLSQGWVDGTLESRADNGQTILSLDQENNTLVATYTGKNVQEFYEYFVIHRENFKPITDAIAADPSIGTFTFELT